MNSRRQHIRRHIYALKRRWGVPVDIYNESQDTFDVETGERNVTIQKWKVKRGVPLPRKVHQDPLLATALKELFSRGATTEMGDRDILIDRKDFPAVLGIENWYVVLENIRYQIVSHEDYEDLAYIVHLKSTTGTPRYAQVEMKVKSRITAESEGTIEP